MWPKQAPNRKKYILSEYSVNIAMVMGLTGVEKPVYYIKRDQN